MKSSQLPGVVPDDGDHNPKNQIKEGAWQHHDSGDWSLNHCKLLYLLSEYARPALSVDDKEGWIRRFQVECVTDSAAFHSTS
jgi:hypothetical protein